MTKQEIRDQLERLFDEIGDRPILNVAIYPIGGQATLDVVEPSKDYGNGFISPESKVNVLVEWPKAVLA